MANTHYDTLGVKRKASEAEIRAAYRKLVLRYHPDRSKDPNAPQIFMRITEAYEVVSDPDLRRRYDLRLDDEVRKASERADRERRREQKEAEQQQRQARVNPNGGTTTQAPGATVSVATMLTKLTLLYTRQQFAACEQLARDILRLSPQEPIPYAILGDISRSRGNYSEAAHFYSAAIQMDPRNANYVKQYEDILARSQWTPNGKRVQIEPEEKRTFAILTILAITLLAAVYIVISPERPLFESISFISTWTFGLFVMLVLCGISAGATLAVTNLIDRANGYLVGKVAPAVSLGMVAFVSFPAAVALYALIGLSQKSFNISTTRLIAAVAFVTVMLAFATNFSTYSGSIRQVLLWGGNVSYMRALRVDRGRQFSAVILWKAPSPESYLTALP